MLPGAPDNPLNVPGRLVQTPPTVLQDTIVPVIADAAVVYVMQVAESGGGGGDGGKGGGGEGGGKGAEMVAVNPYSCDNQFSIDVISSALNVRL